MMKALVVECGRSPNPSVTDFLQQLGFGVVVAHDSDAAFSVYRQNEGVDLAVIGSFATDELGVQMLKELHSHPELASLRTLMVGNSSSHHDIAVALENGADEYVMQPLEWESMGTKLRLLGFDVKE